MPKLMGSLERVYQRKEPSSVQLIVTMMPGAKIVLKDFQELGGIGKKHAHARWN